jgi:cell division FtsZ-interacting protein ZapD
MWNPIKSDPLKRLQKKHAALLAEAHRMSTVDRTRSDALVAEAAKVEDELISLQNAAK